MRAAERTFHRAKRLRRELTLPEVVLWEQLRAGRLGGLRFRRQHPIGPYVLDFYCAERRLCIEVDGAAHDNAQQAARDEQRTIWLETKGINVLRFGANNILKDEHLDAVLRMIADVAAPSTAVPAVPLPRFAGEDQDR